jgi:hypothetical protein
MFRVGLKNRTKPKKFTRSSFEMEINSNMYGHNHKIALICHTQTVLTEPAFYCPFCLTYFTTPYHMSILLPSFYSTHTGLPTLLQWSSETELLELPFVWNCLCTYLIHWLKPETDECNKYCAAAWVKMARACVWWWHLCLPTPSDRPRSQK